MFSTVFKMEECFVMGANCIPWAVSQHKPKAVMTFLTPKQHPPLSCSLSLSLPPSIAHTQSNGGIIVPQGFRRWHICHLEMCHCILKNKALLPVWVLKDRVFFLTLSLARSLAFPFSFVRALRKVFLQLLSHKHGKCQKKTCSSETQQGVSYV